MYDTNFDRQKLMYHPRELAAWLDGGNTRGPVYTEMELSSQCNCKCIFCGPDYLVNTAEHMLDASTACGIISELHAMGNKSIMFSGHGEPLLNPSAGDIIRFASERMSTSLTTNGAALTASRLSLIDGLEWIRFSINGGTSDNYARVQGASPEMFDRVITHLTAAVERKASRGLNVVIGTQLVLLPENIETVLELAARLKGIGVDYFSVKPFSQHPLGSRRPAIDYNRFADIGRQLDRLEDESFRVIFRALSMAKVGRPKDYDTCYGTHFLSFIAANADVWECNVFAGDDRFLIGNAGREKLDVLWHGPTRKKVLDFIEKDLDVRKCRDICRMDECNKYLWRLKHPWSHDDFI